MPRLDRVESLKSRYCLCFPMIGRRQMATVTEAVTVNANDRFDWFVAPPTRCQRVICIRELFIWCTSTDDANEGFVRQEFWTIEQLNIWICICDHSSAFSKWGIWFPVVKHRKGLKEEEGWHWGKSRKGWYWPPHPLQSTHMPLEYLFILHQKGKKGRIKNGQPLGSKNIHLHPAHIFHSLFLQITPAWVHC